jgi:hypothetical protein
MRKPVTGLETFNDLMIDTVSYDTFKKRCYLLSKTVDQTFLVAAIVNRVLQFQFGISDYTKLDGLIQRHQTNAAYVQTLQDALDGKLDDKSELEKFLELVQAQGLAPNEDVTRKQLNMVKAKFIELESEAEANCKRNYALYEYFCEKVVAELLKEKIEPSLFTSSSTSDEAGRLIPF